MRRFLRSAIVVSLLVLVGCASAPQSAPLYATVPVAAAKPVEKAFPVPVVVLSGNGDEIGEQHGQRLSPAIHTLHDKYLNVMLGNPTQRLAAALAAKVFESQLPPEHQAEVHGLAQGTGIPETDTMLGQCFLDLSEMSACSTITLPANAAPDHVARFGRDLEFPGLDVADKYTTLFIVRPNDGRYSFASVGWPGMIGVLSGMNEHGLCLASMEITRQPRLPRAMPYIMLYRSVLERCRTVDEAVALLQKTPIQTANNLMLMDADGNRAVAELTPDAVHIRRARPEAALLSTNHQRGQDQDTPGLCPRYDYLHRTAASMFGQIDTAAIEHMLAHVGDETTLQSMVFEPANRVIYLSAGTNAAKGKFNRLDLRPYFAK